MPNLRNGSKGGFEPGLSRLRVRHSTTELLRSTLIVLCMQSAQPHLNVITHIRVGIEHVCNTILLDLC